MILPTHLDLWQSTLHWQPTDRQQALFQQLYEQILEGNKQLNLTRITEPDDFWEKHLWDSLSGISPWLAKPKEDAVEAVEQPNVEQPDVEQPKSDGAIASESLQIIDIGTGCGFPGVPAAIALSGHLTANDLSLTLVDSTRKKVQFLQSLCHTLGLPATCLAERAETLGQDMTHRESYDLALIRAVGPPATCAEYVLPLLRVGGQAVLYRGQWTTEDTEAILPVIELLGGELTDLKSWHTPLTQSARHCLFIYKERPTPNDLPRAVGVPGKSPLN
ncbi:MAG: 16S rRNA (guanine(527)-N(7))-methyltransferase RsmG [Cyanobacteria bacterium P01_F01_bin.3]